VETWLSDPCKRLEKYIANFEASLRTLRVLDSTAKKVLDLALRYLEDSKYFLGKGDCLTGLVTISYAEGLLDALRMMGAIEIEWIRAEELRVVVAGSFDIVHPGHIEFLRWASNLGNKLFVIVARDSTYRRLRGIEPAMNEVDRLRVVSSIKYVYDAVLGSEHDFLEPLERLKPHIVALGPDQRIDEKDLEEELLRRGIRAKVVRMRSRVGSYSSTSIKRRILELYRLYAGV